jgi:hypothetical protein
MWGPGLLMNCHNPLHGRNVLPVETRTVKPLILTDKDMKPREGRLRALAHSALWHESTELLAFKIHE